LNNKTVIPCMLKSAFIGLKMRGRKTIKSSFVKFMNICREMNVALKRAVLCFIPLGSRSLRQLRSLLGQDTTLRDGDTGEQLVKTPLRCGWQSEDDGR
jgi:hypothetical protein